MEQVIQESVSYGSDKISPYLCSVYAYITDEVIPNLLRDVPELPYFIYGGQADAIYSKDKHPLTSDWDIIINDKKNPNIIPSFAEAVSNFIAEKVNTKFSHVGNIKVIFKNKEYNHERSTGRYTVCLVDPYMPYEKTYDCIDIAGCHESSEGANYCDIFDTRQKIDGIYYANPAFIISETMKVIKGERRHKLTSDTKSLEEAIKGKQIISRKINKGEEIDFEDLDIIENFQDIIDKYLSSFVKLSRTEKRRQNEN